MSSTKDSYFDNQIPVNQGLIDTFQSENTSQVTTTTLANEKVVAGYDFMTIIQKNTFLQE